jgi:anaerobic selenocysteine-containing dehydrogenase
LASFFSNNGITLEKLKENPDGFDLGPLEPKGRDVLQTKDGKLQLAPDILSEDLARLEQAFAESEESDDTMKYKLIGRRQLRSNNSWLHNSERMVRGKKRCTLLLHPDDAAEIGVEDGDEVEVRSAQGALVISTEVSDEIMPGVVSIPHGWGHDKDDTQVETAKANPGVSINDIVDAQLMDELTGVAALNGIPVEISGLS